MDSACTWVGLRSWFGSNETSRVRKTGAAGLIMGRSPAHLGSVRVSMVVKVAVVSAHGADGATELRHGQQFGRVAPDRHGGSGPGVQRILGVGQVKVALAPVGRSMNPRGMMYGTVMVSPWLPAKMRFSRGLRGVILRQEGIRRF